MYLAIIILTLLGSIVSGFFGRKAGVSGAQIFACTAVVTTTILAVLAFSVVGLVSPCLFICAGGVLYYISSTRVISFYRGVTQVMPLFSILFFLLCLSNCGALSLNFIGEFLSSLLGVFASSSIIFSAAYWIYMYQRIAYGGVYSRMFTFSIPDLTKRKFTVLFILVISTVLFGIYHAPILDAIHYSVSTLIYSFEFNVIKCDAPPSNIDDWTADDWVRFYLDRDSESVPRPYVYPQPEVVNPNEISAYGPQEPVVPVDCLDCDQYRWSDTKCDCKDGRGDD